MIGQIIRNSQELTNQQFCKVTNYHRSGVISKSDVIYLLLYVDCTWLAISQQLKVVTAIKVAWYVFRAIHWNTESLVHNGFHNLSLHTFSIVLANLVGLGQSGHPIYTHTTHTYTNIHN